MRRHLRLCNVWSTRCYNGNWRTELREFLSLKPLELLELSESIRPRTAQDRVITQPLTLLSLRFSDPSDLQCPASC